jgi:hypothetical protein
MSGNLCMLISFPLLEALAALKQVITSDQSGPSLCWVLLCLLFILSLTLI